MNGRLARLAVALAAILAVLATLAGPAAAHRGEQSYLYLDVAVNDLEGRVELPYTDIREAFGLALEQPPEALLAELEANLPMLLDYIRAHTTIGADGQAWNLNFGEVDLLGEGAEESGGLPGYAIFPVHRRRPR